MAKEGHHITIKPRGSMPVNALENVYTMDPGQGLTSAELKRRRVRGIDRFKKKVEFHNKVIEDKWGIPMECPEKK